MEKEKVTVMFSDGRELPVVMYKGRSGVYIGETFFPGWHSLDAFVRELKRVLGDKVRGVK